MSHPRKAVDDRKDGSVALGRRKSIAASAQGRLGTGSGRSRPTDGCYEVLFWAHMTQAAIYSFMSASIDGHQNRCLTTNNDLGIRSRRKMGPVDDLGAKIRRHKQTIRRASIRRLGGEVGLLDSLLYLPEHGSDGGRI